MSELTYKASRMEENPKECRWGDKRKSTRSEDEDRLLHFWSHRSQQENCHLHSSPGGERDIFCVSLDLLLLGVSPLLYVVTWCETCNKNSILKRLKYDVWGQLHFKTKLGPLGQKGYSYVEEAHASQLCLSGRKVSGTLREGPLAGLLLQ